MPQFLLFAAVVRLRYKFVPMSGPELQQVVQEAGATPPQVVARLRDLIEKTLK
jgi:hypothetical protein